MAKKDPADVYADKIATSLVSKLESAVIGDQEVKATTASASVTVVIKPKSAEQDIENHRLIVELENESPSDVACDVQIFFEGTVLKDSGRPQGDQQAGFRVPGDSTRKLSLALPGDFEKNPQPRFVTVLVKVGSEIVRYTVPAKVKTG